MICKHPLKKISYFLFLLAICGCQSKSNTQTAALLSSSALIASAEDSVILTALEHKLTPNDIHRLDRHYPKTLEKLEKYRNLNAQDIKNMTRAGVTDDVIIHEIKATRSSFFLTPEDERELEQAGVSRKVIMAMKQTVDDRY
ncbi:MAG: hypothetical protein K940chlam6_00740 [Chlamydiae bacterium]|nr:hypothetical protein [Chlamydiota bacterium]